MKDKKVIELTLRDVGKILCWSLGITAIITAIVFACFYFFS